MSFANVLNVSVSASWLVLAVAALRLVLKKAPRALHCALWALVAVRLLCPAMPESSLSLIPTAQVIPEQQLAMEPREDTGQPATLEIVSNPNYPEPVTIELDTDVDGMQWLDVKWTILWWTGMGAMGLYALFSFLSLRLRLRYAMKLEGNVLICDDIDSPFILGLIRPRICLPSSLGEEQRAFVLAHERAHLRRRDHWWKVLGFGLLSVHWFNPVMWLGYGLLCRDIELACDEAVISRMDRAGVRQYSQTLVALGVRQRFVTACPLAFGEVGVKKRVKSMLRYRKPGFWIVLAALVLSGAVMLCFMTDPMRCTTLSRPPEELESLNLEAADRLGFIQGDFQIWETDQAQETARRLSELEISVAPVSRNRSEDRDRTYEISVDGVSLYISADCAEIWVDDGVKPSLSHQVKEPQALRLILEGYFSGLEEQIPAFSGTYVPYQCLYMNSLSSYYPFGGDSGSVYHFGERSFTEESRYGAVTVYDPVEWDWQRVDWEAEPFSGWSAGDILSNNSSMQTLLGTDGWYQQLSADRFLLWDGERLVLVDTYEIPGRGTGLWSAYRLVLQQQMGLAEWTFDPASGDGCPVFRFRLDMQYDSLSASAAVGKLVSTGESSAPEDGGNTLELPAGVDICWCPTDGSGSVAEEDRIHFTVSRGNAAAARGTIYITSVETALGQRLYTARIVGTGLHLEQSPEGGVITSGWISLGTATIEK